jgi:hypothetical protein
MSSPLAGIDRREALRRAALLLGGIISAPTVAAMLASCEGRDAAERGARALTAEHQALIAAIAELIIPETDTPGARAVGVPLFIATMLEEYFSADDRDHFLAGLAEVDARARRGCGKRFLDCSPTAQHDLLVVLDGEAYRKVATPAVAPPSPDERGQTENASPGQRSSDSTRAKMRASRMPFFRTMKELTLVGYYTSQAGATRELRYVQVPGRFEGCVPLATVGRAWAV